MYHAKIAPMLMIITVAGIAILTTVLISPAFAEDATNHDFSNYPCFVPECTFDVMIGNQTYPIKYQVWSENENRTAVAELGEIIADVNGKSLIAKVRSDNNGSLILYIPKNVLNTEIDGHEFTFLINNRPATYEEAYEPQWATEFDYRTVQFRMDKNTEEIEIIGQRMMPEIPAVVIVMAIGIAIVVGTGILTKSHFSRA